MLYFECDYTEGAHEKVLDALIQTNMTSLPGYGNDAYCDLAKEKIRAACGHPEAAVQFLVGGTQTNTIVIAAQLRPCEGVIAAKTGHISVHEGGAIEATGHKVLELPQEDGKIRPADLKAYLAGFYADGNHTHMVYPGMVYISHPTEYGTLYSKQELTEISQICHEYEIPLFMDGARLGYGLMSYQTDVTLKDIADLCDVFYIGGTKVGALCGEAVVYPKGNLPRNFTTFVKQRGALLAKGRVLGIQFDALFTDDLYCKISRHAIDMAEKMKVIFKQKGYPFFLESPTNQQFIILENKHMEELKSKVAFSFWEPADENHTVVRFATSWATTQEALDQLEAIL